MAVATLPRTALAAFSADMARDFACNLLRAAGIVSVLPTGGGQDAVHSARCQSVDIIVTDWPEHDVDLPEFIHALRSGKEGSCNTPVVLLTTREGRADLDAARKAGVSAYMVKPVSTAMMKHWLAAVVKNAPAHA